MSEIGGNVVWWLLLGLSVVALAILFEGLFTVRQARIVPRATAEALANSVKLRAYGDAVRLAEDPAHQSLLARVVIAGIRRARDDPNATAGEIRSSCQEEGEGLADGLYRRAERWEHSVRSRLSSGCLEPRFHWARRSRVSRPRATRPAPPTSPPPRVRP